MSDNVSDKLKDAAEQAKQTAERQLAAAGSEAEEVVRELAVRSREQLARSATTAPADVVVRHGGQVIS